MPSGQPRRLRVGDGVSGWSPCSAPSCSSFSNVPSARSRPTRPSRRKSRRHAVAAAGDVARRAAPYSQLQRGGILRQMFAYEVLRRRLRVHRAVRASITSTTQGVRRRRRGAPVWLRSGPTGCALYGLLSTPFLIFSLLYLGLGQLSSRRAPATTRRAAASAPSPRASRSRRSGTEEDAADDAQLAAEEAEEAAGVPAADGVVARLRDDARIGWGAGPPTSSGCRSCTGRGGDG